MFNKVKVNFIDKEWNPIIKKGVRIKYIPREGELIYISEHQQYYRTINVIHTLDKIKKIIIIIEKFGDKIKLSD